MTFALELKTLRKSFGKTEIIRGVNLAVKAGERVAIIGPNGAGKSTLFNLISGRFAPTSGEVLLNGERIDGMPPHRINRLGLSRSFQITNIFPKLSVFENLRCGVLWSLGYRYTFLRFLSSMHDANERAEQLMEMIRLERKRDVLADQPHLRRAARAGDRHHHRRRRQRDPAGRAHRRHEQERDARASSTLIKEVTVGKTLLTVEHDMGVVFGLADKIAVVVYGEVIAFDTPEAVRANPRVQEAYLGSLGRRRAGGGPLSMLQLQRPPRLLRQEPCAARRVRSTSAPGEIVALLGRNGSGRSTTAKAIMGLVACRGHARTGRARTSCGRKAYEIAHLGIGYVPENRDIFPKLTVHQNLLLGQKGERQGQPLVASTTCTRMFPRLKERQHTEAGVLSGGEQQMLTLCRTLMGDPDLIIIDEPTEGLAPKIVELVGEYLRAQGPRHLGAADRAEADHRDGRSPTARW